jgi:glycosyltransferase involved in cell wall biosynthesis
MKILHVIPSLAWERGGPSAVVRALTRHQAEDGHRVSILTTDQGVRRGQKPIDLGPSVSIRQLKVFGPDRVAFAPGFAQAARAELQGADVVHIHSIFTNPVHVALREARQLNVPTILRPCGQLHRYSLQRSSWQKWTYLKIWGGMVRSSCCAWHYTSDNEAEHSWPWQPSRRFVLANGIEPDEYEIDRGESKAFVAKRWPELGDSPYVLFLGRVHPKKRLDLLIDAFLAGAPRKIKLVVAGPDEGGLWEKLSASRLDSLSAKERVVRLGTVTGQDKTCLLAGASLFALPSEHENFGIAALEALAVGTPFLLSPHVDLLSEAASADRIGYTAPLQLELWRDQFSALLRDTAALEAQCERARKWARDNYSWGQLARELTRRYEWVIAGCPPNGLAEATCAKSAS